MGKFVSNVKEFFDFCDKNVVVFVDFRFTDKKGTWHHLSYYYNRLDKDFVDGIPFDGSSVEAWQPINKSDMILKPDIDTAFLDPFTSDVTVIVIAMFMIFIKENFMKNVRVQ